MPATIGYVLTAGLLASLAYLAYGVATSGKFHWKFGLILTSLFGGLVAMWPPGERLRLGIDLSGGTILVYEVKKGATPQNFQMEDLISALKKRVNPDGAKDIPIRPIGGDRVELILPEASADVVDLVKRQLTTQGFLAFRILANRKHDDAEIERALRPENANNPPSGYSWVKLGDVLDGPQASDALTTEDLSINDPGARWPANRYAGSTVYLTGRDSAGLESVKPISIARNTADTIYLEKPHNLKSISRYRIEYNPSEIGGGIGAENPNFGIRDLPRSGGVVERQILVKIPPDRMRVTGNDLGPVYPTESQMKPAVGFTFNNLGARKFGALTGTHLPEVDGFRYHLAIVLDDVVQSAPVINDQIRDSGVITMGKSGPELLKEVDFLTKILQAGSLPGTLNTTPLQEEQIGPTLGRDTIEKGIRAIMISMLVVPIFMIVYYRLAGVIAVLALLLNTILLLGSMALLEASFTLPGLAGFALTIGMSVDSNVLVFERMREEKERGASITQQIRNGYTRAWSAILDTHVTTVLTGIVLWAMGTEEVKGFAITLIVGLIWNLFTAIFVTRFVFETLHSRGLIGELTMMKLLKKTNINFTGPRYYCMAASALLILLGMAAFVYRGGLSRTGDIYNIDFTGGTLVTIRLDPQAAALQGVSESDRAALIREKAGAVLPDPMVESLNVAGEARGSRFNIRTTEPNAEKVRELIVRQFGDVLAKVNVEIGPGQAIPPRAEGAPPPADRDFAGGRSFLLRFNSPQSASRVALDFQKLLDEAKVAAPASRFDVVPEPAKAGGPTTFALRTDLDPAVVDPLIGRLGDVLREDSSLLFERVENFGATVAGESRQVALLAIIASWLIIIGYLWFRFKSVTYGLAAVIALVHDVLIALGAVALSRYFLYPGYKIDLPMIAAFLTIVGFSVNDTIVIFDRIRELKGKTPHLSESIINLAVNQTLSRTILTTLTVFIVVVILYFFGGEGLEPFAFCLLIGFISGTYSTVYIAAPILLDWAGGKTTPVREKVAVDF